MKNWLRSQMFKSGYKERTIELIQPEIYNEKKIELNDNK